MKNQQLREILGNLPAVSKETDELQNFLEGYEREHEKVKEELAATQAALVECEALIKELDKVKGPEARTGKPITGADTVDRFVAQSAKLFPILLNKLAPSGYAMLTLEDLRAYEATGRVIVIKERTDGMTFYLADPDEVKEIQKDDKAFFAQLKLK